MQLASRVLVLAALTLLTACGGVSTLQALNRAQFVGSPYTQQLAVEYRDLANQLGGGVSYLGNYFGGNPDSKHFARKALAAADGVIVMPEVLEDWELSGGNAVELIEARAHLVNALENGAREIAPYEAAIAQSRFDCWTAGVGRLKKSNRPCKEEFYNVYKAMETAVAGAAPPVVAAPAPAPVASEEFPMPVTDMPRGAPVPLQQATFLTFFDWDKYNLSASAKDVLNTIAREVKGRSDVKQVVIVGHTDTSGGDAYNQKLSLKRGNAARDYLVSAGLPSGKVRVEGHGEKELLVKTSDNVREPANRRAQITLE